jgi:NAD(P)-dependent dehydrogenase (short-subunit alcohol dehydrogenase family)
MKLAGRHVVVTGASLGLGRAIARACLAEGAHVLICARERDALEGTLQNLRQRAPDGTKVWAKICDVSDEQQVNALAEFAQRELGACDVLINNAGVLGPIGPVEEVAWADWKRTIEIDLFGVALPCRAFLSGMKSRRRGKIINLSGGGATGPRPLVSAYAAAKTAVVRFTETLAVETRSFGIDVNAIAPGAIHTRMTEQARAAGLEEEIKFEKLKLESIPDPDDDVPLAAAQLCVFLASAESDGITGRLISARWDDWENLAAQREALAAGDIYTLRRIVPEDRGADWGGVP